MKSIRAILAGGNFSRFAAARREMAALQSAVCAVLQKHAIAADFELRLDGDILHIAVAAAPAAVRLRNILPTLRRELKSAPPPAPRIADVRLSRRIADGGSGAARGTRDADGG